LQEIFIQIWKEADRYSPKAGKPLGWMVTIARRRAIDRLRRRQAYSRVRERYQERVIQQAPNSPRETDDVFVLNDLRHFSSSACECCRGFSARRSSSLSSRDSVTGKLPPPRAPLGTVKTRLELGLQKLTHTLRPLRHKV
jgi:DNA-directed RNA polymerase specialized sigma subunit, sigma24 homolog